MEKTATLNIRVEPEVKRNTEEVLAKLKLPMSTAISLFLQQIYLTGGLPFAVTLPEAPDSMNMSLMSEAEFNAKLQKGLDEALSGRTMPASAAFADFEKRHGL